MNFLFFRAIFYHKAKCLLMSSYILKLSIKRTGGRSVPHLLSSNQMSIQQRFRHNISNLVCKNRLTICKNIMISLEVSEDVFTLHLQHRLCGQLIMLGFQQLPGHSTKEMIQQQFQCPNSMQLDSFHF